MRFNRCLVTNSISGPCRAVILTGKYSHLNGLLENEGQAPFDGITADISKTASESRLYILQ